MWPSRVHRPSWLPAPSWAPPAASCLSHLLSLPPGSSLSNSSSGPGTLKGSFSLCSSTQVHRNWSCRSATAGSTWPSTAQDDRDQRFLQVSSPALGSCLQFSLIQKSKGIKLKQFGAFYTKLCSKFVSFKPILKEYKWCMRHKMWILHFLQKSCEPQVPKICLRSWNWIK